MAIQWQLTGFDGLDTRTLYGILRLRVDVFVVEQNCPYAEVDGKDLDPETFHLWACDTDDIPVAYLRGLGPGLSYPGATSLGRVVVAKGHRGRGLSHELVNRGLDAIGERWPGFPVTIGAQEYLKSFYESHGFRAVSPVYLEDGIPHIDMTLDRG
ncbi:MAG: GNAT family N-acetyltransferase [Desulfobacterales bacterium]|nr:GNAT family N-acetyltransferase [Desulfobacterales bacterium]